MNNADSGMVYVLNVVGCLVDEFCVLLNLSIDVCTVFLSDVVLSEFSILGLCKYGLGVFDT